MTSFKNRQKIINENRNITGCWGDGISRSADGNRSRSISVMASLWNCPLSPCLGCIEELDSVLDRINYFMYKLQKEGRKLDDVAR